MKIYRVIFKCTDLDEYYNAVTITTFQNKELAEQYLKEKIEELKREEKSINLNSVKIVHKQAHTKKDFKKVTLKKFI